MLFLIFGYALSIFLYITLVAIRGIPCFFVGLVFSCINLSASLIKSLSVMVFPLDFFTNSKVLPFFLYMPLRENW